MQAKLILFGDKMEIKLTNGVLFFATKDEVLDDFVNRVEAVVERDYVEDLDIRMVEEKTFSKVTPKELQRFHASATGLEQELLASMLEAKGIEIGTTPAKPGKVTNDSVGRVAKLDKVKAEKPEKVKKEKVVKEKKERTPVVRMTDEEVEALAESVKNVVGSICTFISAGTAITTRGEVKQVIIDKRVNKAYYRIIGDDGKLYHTIVGSINFKVDATATKELKAERKATEKAKADELAAAAKAKETAKKEAADTKAAELKAKEATKKETAAKKAADAKAKAAEAAAKLASKGTTAKAKAEKK